MIRGGTCARSGRWPTTSRHEPRHGPLGDGEPSFTSSPWIRGAPHNGLASAISRIRRRRSPFMRRRPPSGRDRRVQYHAKPRRCQSMTVAGRRMTRADCHLTRRAAARPRRVGRSSGPRAWVGSAGTWPTADGGRGSRGQRSMPAREEDEHVDCPDKPADHGSG